jgi:parallel beta-helix repeat protein
VVYTRNTKKGGKMNESKYYGGHALRIAVGIMALVLVIGGVAGAVTPIGSCGTISSPGEYILTQNIVNFSNGTCIAITSNDVVFNGANYVIDGVTKNYTYGVYVNNKLTTINNVTLKNLKVTDWNYGIYFLNAKKGNITNSIVSLNGNESNSIVINGTRSFPSKGIHLDNSNDISITDNIVNSNNQSGISLSQSSNNSILRNDIDSNSFSGVMLTIESSNNTIEKNRVSNHSYIGIMVIGSSNNIIKNNNIENNEVGLELGIWVVNRSAGIEVYSTNNTLTDNTVTKNNQSGIKLGNSCNNNTITNNTINSNNQIGLFLTQSSFNYVGHNKVSNNQYGIKLSSSSSNNIIYNNYFNNINNTDLKKNFDNRWHISRIPGINIIGGRYLGGNFWGYPNGTGFSQTCPDTDADGICDSAYVLDNNNTDYLPLAYRSTSPSNVSISDSSFQPQTINVTAGTTVTWTNFDPVAHTVTSDTGLFDSGSISTGKIFSRKFNTAGIFYYHCSIYPSMTGSVIVTSGNPPPNNVSISDSSFHPQTINVTAGTTVTWTNLDPLAHTSFDDRKCHSDLCESSSCQHFKSAGIKGNYLDKFELE